MGRNVTSLEYVPRGLSKPSQALALTPSGLRLLCVQLHLEAWTTAVPVLGGGPFPATGWGKAVVWAVCALPENLASPGASRGTLGF